MINAGWYVCLLFADALPMCTEQEFVERRSIMQDVKIEREKRLSEAIASNSAAPGLLVCIGSGQCYGQQSHSLEAELSWLAYDLSVSHHACMPVEEVVTGFGAQSAPKKALLVSQTTNGGCGTDGFRAVGY